ncbi:amidophosphoribosyltransferase [bacterium]|nr:amidophosphoribosyltransferase [bacterium]
MSGTLKEHCGVVGIYNHPEAANLAYLGLYALQHRGQESAGILSLDGNKMFIEKGMGKVADVINQARLAQLPGSAAIGHVRYSTSGESSLAESQPLMAKYASGTIGITHNGNLINAERIRSLLVEDGSIFQSTTDSEVIVHLIARSRAAGFAQRVIDSLSKIEGAYSLIFLTETQMIGTRDPHGFHPLALGRIGDGYCIVSETCAMDLIGATLIREIDPGEMVIIDETGIKSFRPFPSQKTRFCVFEYIYFARPDSTIHGLNVHMVRKEFGRQLARESAVDADVVISIPDSGTSAALGYAEESGIPYDIGMIRNRYVGRTFIEPKQSIRHFGVKLKLNPVKELLSGKRVIVIDDSIVRATTSKKIVSLIRGVGAREIHLRISSPPTCFSCYYGIDTPTRQELIASSHTKDQICSYVEADSLEYISVEGMRRSVGPMGDKICDACFTGDYPLPVKEEHFVQLRLFDSI